MIAVVEIDRHTVPTEFRNTATTVPTIIVSTTHTSAKPTVFGRTVFHRKGSESTWR